MKQKNPRSSEKIQQWQSCAEPPNPVVLKRHVNTQTQLQRSRFGSIALSSLD